MRTNAHCEPGTSRRSSSLDGVLAKTRGETWLNTPMLSSARITRKSSAREYSCARPSSLHGLRPGGEQIGKIEFRGDRKRAAGPESADDRDNVVEGCGGGDGCVLMSIVAIMDSQSVIWI